MKLFGRYNRVNILATILVLLIGGFCYYFLLRRILIHQLDNALKVEEAEIIDFVKNKNQLPEPTSYRDQVIRYTASQEPTKRKFKSVSLLDAAEAEMKPFRQLEFSVSIRDQFFTVSVTKSQAEAEFLLGSIAIMTLAVIMLLLLIQFLANRLMLRKLWSPFYEILGSIKQFNLAGQKVIPLQRTNIEEFEYLNETINQMTQKISTDYETLKNFADNASHEMQTPLAIINSKLDLLIQDQSISEKHGKQLQAMYEALGRLTKLNQSLLLLTKIENNQFAETETIKLNELVAEKIQQLKELIDARGLKLSSDLKVATLQVNNYLADILLNNLLVNAIRHNIDHGCIHVHLEPRELLIKNSGPPLPFDSAAIFDKFSKNSHSDGAGLGLAIVKQICEKYHFNLSYAHAENNHSFIVRF